MITALSVHQDALRDALNELKNDRKCMITALSVHQDALRDASNELKNDRDFVLQALKVSRANDCTLLSIHQSTLWSDPFFVLAVMRCYDGEVLVFAGPEVQNNDNVVFAAIQRFRDYRCLKEFYNASDSLRDNKTMALAALKQCCSNLQYASDALKADKEVVIAAMKQDPWVFRFSSLKNDYDFALRMTRQDDQVFNHVSHLLQRDEVFTTHAILCNSAKHAPKSIESASSFASDACDKGLND